MDSPATGPISQIFASDGSRRRNAARAGLIAGAALLAAWVAAVALGTFGGFSPLPGLEFGKDGKGPDSGAPAAREAGSEPGARLPAVSDSSRQGDAQPGPGGGSGAAGGPAPPGSRQVSANRPGGGQPGAGSKPTSPKPVTTTPTQTAKPTGQPDGAGTGSGSGKPIGTPGQGSTGSNAGGVSGDRAAGGKPTTE